MSPQTQREKAIYHNDGSGGVHRSDACTVDGAVYIAESNVTTLARTTTVEPLADLHAVATHNGSGNTVELMGKATSPKESMRKSSLVTPAVGSSAPTGVVQQVLAQQLPAQPSLPAASTSSFFGVGLRSTATTFHHRTRLEMDRQNQTTGDCAAGPCPGGGAAAHATVRELGLHQAHGADEEREKAGVRPSLYRPLVAPHVAAATLP